ncbi:MAG: class I SAM-dependent methyltransferase [Oscillospiraceae bacterium]|nr:class I SAM-dependent methyltransferase [Oscillospiraceae bacterium]
MNRQFIAKHWYADVYEQFENQTYDVEFLLGVLREQCGGKPQNILETACGGGRISVPLAEAGHSVTGFDADEHMLMRCYKRMGGLPNIRCYKADAVTSDWGADFDVVVLAGNVLINIETEADYAQAQTIFIRKAAEALRQGGHLYLDFDLHTDPAPYFNSLGETTYLAGTDDMGTSGRMVSYGGVYDLVTRIFEGVKHLELMQNNGENVIVPMLWHKHIPSQAQVFGWLEEAGFELERTYRDYTDEPLAEPETEHVRATIWARKK